MNLESNECNIEIKVDETYTVDSADNRYYDIVLNPCHYKRSDVATTLSIHIDLFSRDFYIALIGPFYAYDSDCAVLDRTTLTILQHNTITQINVVNGSIIRHIEFESFGCNYGIYKVEKGYIIYGELEITMLDFDFVKKWTFRGKDIFASISGKNPFELGETSICLYDFEDNYYEIDYDGNPI